MCTHAAIPDDILELILVRLESTACLIRASSTCKRWRRLIAGVGFLRRFRSIHGPPIAGTYHDSARLRRPAGFVPSPSSGIDGRHFSLDFLPGIRDSGSSVIWTIKDTRAGLVLLARHDRRVEAGYKQDLVVCEPLSRRYEIIAPLSRSTWYGHTNAFLLDGDSSMTVADGGSIGLSNFKVISRTAASRHLDGTGGFKAAVFSSHGSSYRLETIRIHGQSSFRYFNLMGHSKGSIYWWVQGGIVVVVDRTTANVASFVLRDGVEGFDDDCDKATIATGRDGKARIMVGRHYSGDVKVFAARQMLAAGGSEWVLEKTIRLHTAATPSRQWQNSCWRFSWEPDCQRKGIVFIGSGRLFLALDLDSETIEDESALKLKLGYPLELPWPPVLRACTQPGTDLGDHDR